MWLFNLGFIFGISYCIIYIFYYKLTKVYLQRLESRSYSYKQMNSSLLDLTTSKSNDLKILNKYYESGERLVNNSGIFHIGETNTKLDELLYKNKVSIKLNICIIIW